MTEPESRPAVTAAYPRGVAPPDRPDARAGIATSTMDGAVRQGFAEYWDPDTAEGHGAAPQSWTALALLMHPDHNGPAQAGVSP